MADDRIVSIVGSVPDDLLIKFIDLLDGTHAQVRATRLVWEDGIVGVDPISQALIGITHLHEMIHSQKAYTSSVVDETLGNNDHLVALLRNPAGSGKAAHFVFAVAMGGNALLQFITGVTVTAQGTALTRSNRSMGSARAAVCRTFHTPTVADGVVRLADLLPGGTGGIAAGGAADQRFEWNIPPGTDVVVDLQNISGQARVASIRLEWYENEEEA